MNRFLILDDEPFSRENLASHLQMLGYACEIEKCKTIAEAKAVLANKPIDIIFLDYKVNLWKTSLPDTLFGTVWTSV